jgi:uncharacterized membrane protein YkgB
MQRSPSDPPDQQQVHPRRNSVVEGIGSSIDQVFRKFEQQYGCRMLRYSLAFVFFWFGITKPLGISPANQVVRPTLAHTPILSELISFPMFFSLLGLWEALVGIGLLWRRTIRIAVGCMCLQMAATFTPLFVIPAETFQWWPLVPSTPGFYVMKNFALATAGLVVAALESDRLLPQRYAPWLRQTRGPWIEIRSKVTKAISRDNTAQASVLRDFSLTGLHAGLAIVFIWSGILMVTTSPSPGHWIASVVPNVLVANSVLIPLLGVLELAIGLYLLIPSFQATHVAAYLSIGYIGMAMLPVVFHPAQVFVSFPFEPTFEGVYIFKDFILVTGILTIDAHKPTFGALGWWDTRRSSLNR